METELEAVQRQINAENERHTRVINDLKQKQERENKQHEYQMQALNSRKEQIKRFSKNKKPENFVMSLHRKSIANELDKIIVQAMDG